MFLTLSGLVAAAVRLIQNLNKIAAMGGDINDFHEERRNVLMSTSIFGTAMAVCMVITLLF